METLRQIPVTKLQLHNTLYKKGTLMIRAINHPLRQNILQNLHRNETMSVTELYVSLRLEQAVVSCHLAILRKAGFVLRKRKGKHNYYSVNQQRLDLVHEWLMLL